MEKPDERQIVAQLTERLQGRFPTVEREQVTELVTRLYGEYDDSHIRDYIPVLVEKDAVAILRTPG